MGTLVVSLEAELAWGFPRVEPPPADIEDARDGWRAAIDAFDRHDVPATWAVVGHLYLDACPGDHADHPGGPNVCHRSVGDCSAREAWFGDGLVAAVREAEADHELAGHGFTHVPFDADHLDASDALRKLEWTRQAAQRRGIDCSTLVFPADRPAHRQVLATLDFECYRTPGPARRTDREETRDTASDGGDVTPPLVRPRVDEYGLVNVPTSAYLFDPAGPIHPLVGSESDDPLTARAVRGVEAAADGDGVCHLSLHPHDLTDDRSVGRLQAVLDRAATLRDRGALTVRTMADVAAATRDEQFA
ncbi:polysaccharide deacetylase [Halobacteriales archaeon Cl-PHB]